MDSRPPSDRTVAVILTAGIGLFCCMAIIVFFFLGDIARAVTQYVPYQYDQKAGEAAAQLLEKGQCDAPEAKKSLHKLTRVLLKDRWDFERQPFTFYLIDSPMVNAGALPGGHIMIFRGIFQKAETQNEFIGVLAHELQHVILRHSMSSLIETGMMAGFWSIILGDFSEVAAISTAQANELLGLRFSRLAEFEADRGALRLLDDAKISRKGFASFWKKSSEDDDEIFPILSTHPPSEERYDLAKIGDPKHRQRRILTKKEWVALKTFCED
jgi:beta-barrel assembly-enhancing protease